MDKRILDHPVLGKTPERELVKFTYNGKTLEGYKGEPIAAALKVAGVMAHRYTKRNLLCDWKMYGLCHGR